MLKDTATYSSETGGTALEDLEHDQIEARKSMLDTDPPEHTSLRAIVNKGFTPRAVAAYEELLRELTRTILDEALPKGEFDFIEDVAKQLPIRCCAAILGVPLEDDEQADRAGATRMIGKTDPDLAAVSPEQPESEQYRLLPFRSPVRARALSTMATTWPPSGAGDPQRRHGDQAGRRRRIDGGPA